MSLVVEKIQGLDWEQIKELLKERKVQCGLLAGLVGVYLLRRALRKPKYNLPPGPRGLPLIGNMIGLTTMQSMHKKFVEWRKTYGDVFTIHMGPTKFIVLSSADAIREAFITKGPDFAGRLVTLSNEYFTEGGKDIALAQPTPVWKLQRQIAHASIRKYASGATLENNMQSAFDSFVYGVTQHDDHIVDVPDEITKMLYNFLSTMCFGKHFVYNDPWLRDFVQLFKDMMDAVGSGFLSDFLPALKFLERGKYRLVLELLDQYNVLLRREFDEHRQTFDVNSPRDLIDEILVQMHKQQESPEANPVLTQLSESHLNQIIGDVFFAGTDTSRLTLSIMIGLVAERPEVQRRMHQELDDVLGDSGRVTLRTKDELPYTSGVIHEAMRLRSVAPIGLPHCTTRDTSIGKYTLPKNTAVIGYTHGVHMDPDNFPNPEEFIPERWIDDKGKFQYMPFKFIPFSMGPRVCLGESLARADLVMFTAMLFHKYEFRPVDESKPFVCPMKEIMMAFMTEPYKLKLIERH